MSARASQPSAAAMAATRSPVSALQSWSPELQREAVRRLSSLCLMFGVAKLISIPLFAVTPLHDALPLAPLDYWLTGLFVVMSLALYALIRFTPWSPGVLLDLGHVYGVATAFVLGLTVNRMPLPEELFPAWSPVAIWTFFFFTIVPARLWKALVGSAVMILMDPLTLVITARVDGRVLPGYALGFRLGVGVSVVLLVLFASRIVYGLGVRATEARELGSYRLLERLGRGGMGEVWHAEHQMLARPAAVKLIRPENLNASGERVETLVRRFEREARATARLTSPNTVQIFDFGVTDEGTFYYVMELLDGIDLELLVERFGPVGPARTVHLLRQATRSLFEAHERGLIHRDIKPANLFTCRYGGLHDFVKVLDFGLVKVLDEGGPGGDVRLTREGLATGTPAFIAPEMALGQAEITGAADVYALGCVGYWLLTGDLVFRGKTPMEMIIRHVETPPEPPSARSELDIPPGLDAVILECLAKRPEDRPASARALDDALGAIELADSWTEEEAARWWQRHKPEALTPSTESGDHPHLGEVGTRICARRHFRRK